MREPWVPSRLRRSRTFRRRRVRGGAGDARLARRSAARTAPLSAASFRDLTRSQASIARNLAVIARVRKPYPETLPPREGIQPRCSGLRVQGTAGSPPSATGFEMVAACHGPQRATRSCLNGAGILGLSGRIAQRESARFTRGRSLVRSRCAHSAGLFIPRCRAKSLQIGVSGFVPYVSDMPGLLATVHTPVIPGERARTGATLAPWPPPSGQNCSPRSPRPASSSTAATAGA